MSHSWRSRAAPPTAYSVTPNASADPLPCQGTLPLQRAPLQRRLGLSEVADRIDQGDMRKRLREVSCKPPSADVVFFGKQADVVPKRQHPLQQLDRLFAAIE